MQLLNRIILDSEISSEVFQEPEGITATAVAVDPNEKARHQTFSERCALPHSTDLNITCERLPGKESAYPVHFLSEIAVREHNTNILFSRFKHQNSVLIYRAGMVIPSITTVLSEQFYHEGPPDDDWTVSAWALSGLSVLDELFNLEFLEFEKDMRSILNHFGQPEPFQRPNDIIKLAEEIAANMAEPEQETDDTWADRLADELSRSTD